MQAMVAGRNVLQQVKKLPTHSYSTKHCKQLWSGVCNSHTNFSRGYGVSAVPSAHYSTTPVTADRRTTDIDPEASTPQTTIDTMNQLGTSSRWNRKTKRRGRTEATSVYSASAYTASDHPHTSLPTRNKAPQSATLHFTAAGDAPHTDVR